MQRLPAQIAFGGSNIQLHLQIGNFELLGVHRGDFEQVQTAQHGFDQPARRANHPAFRAGAADEICHQFIFGGRVFRAQIIGAIRAAFVRRQQRRAGAIGDGNELKAVFAGADQGHGPALVNQFEQYLQYTQTPRPQDQAGAKDGGRNVAGLYGGCHQIFGHDLGPAIGAKGVAGVFFGARRFHGGAVDHIRAPEHQMPVGAAFHPAEYFAGAMNGADPEIFITAKAGIVGGNQTGGQMVNDIAGCQGYGFQRAGNADIGLMVRNPHKSQVWVTLIAFGQVNHHSGFPARNDLAHQFTAQKPVSTDQDMPHRPPL